MSNANKYYVVDSQGRYVRGTSGGTWTQSEAGDPVDLCHATLVLRWRTEEFPDQEPPRLVKHVVLTKPIERVAKELGEAFAKLAERHGLDLKLPQEQLENRIVWELEKFLGKECKVYAYPPQER